MAGIIRAFLIVAIIGYAALTGHSAIYKMIDHRNTTAQQLKEI